MGRLFYKPENAWVGDLIPYYENGTYYGFYLHDPRIRDKEYAEDTTWHLIETKDFVNLDYKGESIARGGIHDANKNAYTGSVIKCEKDGLYHVFYTAYNEDFKLRGKTIQSVMQATGKNLENLETVKDFLFVSDGKQYEEFDWRDPFVFWNDEDQCYYMLLASRVTNRGDLRGGCIALCKSEDLINWTYEKPFYDPKMYITMECPELFKMGEYWYLVFSTFSDQFTTHYRISKNWNGPWEIPDDDVFDTRADYAIKTVAIAQLFRSMYATEPMGLINQFFQAIGMEGMVTSWLANIHTALIAVSVPEGWRFTGMYMVIFYAALISLDPSVYEAAKVDGATDFQILLKIKLPLIKDIILLTLTMCLTGALRGFDIPFLLTSGGPGNASELLSTYMYKKAFSNNQYGYGSALAVFIIIESMLVVFILRKIFSERKECKES